MSLVKFVPSPFLLCPPLLDPDTVSPVTVLLSQQLHSRPHRLHGLQQVWLVAFEGRLPGQAAGLAARQRLTWPQTQAVVSENPFQKIQNPQFQKCNPLGAHPLLWDQPGSAQESDHGNHKVALFPQPRNFPPPASKACSCIWKKFSLDQLLNFFLSLQLPNTIQTQEFCCENRSSVAFLWFKPSAHFKIKVNQAADLSPILLYSGIPYPEALPSCTCNTYKRKRNALMLSK